MAKKKLLYIEWYDAVSLSSGWVSKKELEEAKSPLCQTVGWLIKETKVDITVASSKFVEEDLYSGDVTIPKAIVKTKREIKIG